MFTQVRAIGEQAPHRRRYITLNQDGSDSFGRSLVRIRLATSSAERTLIQDMRTACRAVAAELAAPGAHLINTLDPLHPPMIFHPTGGCAMDREGNFPCDAWGKLRLLDNLWIADAAALPSAGDCHPTLTVLAHTLRVCRDVSRRCSSS